MRIHGKRYDTGEYVAIHIDGERIARVDPVEATESLPIVAPGFVDLQVNGFGGREFMDPALTVEMVGEISQAMDAFGVTGYCPTVTTHGMALLERSMRVLARACDECAEVARRLIGIHLEGPYISPEDGPRGAHPLQHCRSPDWDEFQRLQDSAGGRIRILTLAPEYEGAPSFIARVAASGVLVAIGHTSADSEQIRAAVDAGARMSTHLGNGAHGQIRRHPNYIWDQLAEDRLTISLIGDGHHLPPSVIKCLVRAKTPTRCVLISDIVGEAGLPPGRYQNSSVGDVEVLENGRLVVAGQQQYLAGAVLPITHGVANVMRFAELNMATAVDMASTQPAQLLGLPPGRIEVGAAADLVLFDPPADDTSPIRVRRTIHRGRMKAEG
ncbi:MAG: N-acetylglucosamine-6-phosphate deacetylase [Pirellulaceae bacterium]